jgi:fructosamine-3-kinase
VTATAESLVAAHADEYELRRRLHDVPPHEVWEVVVDGRRAVCKVTTDPRGTAGVEGRVLRYVGRETTVPVPAVWAVGADGFLAAYCDDAPEAPDDPVLDPAWIDAAGRALARLHGESSFDRPGLLAVDGDPGDTAAGLRVDAPAGAAWPDALDDLLALYGDALAGTGFRGVVEAAREFVADHADRLSLPGDRDPALLHGWFTPEHVAVADGAVRRAIDFEHALVGSGEWDYWRTAVPLFRGSNWTAPDGAKRRFREAYESVRPLPAGVEERGPAYRALVSVSYLDSLHAQRGIDDDTRETAEAIADHVRESLAAVRAEWD